MNNNKIIRQLTVVSPTKRQYVFSEYYDGTTTMEWGINSTMFPTFSAAIDAYTEAFGVMPGEER